MENSQLFKTTPIGSIYFVDVLLKLILEGDFDDIVPERMISFTFDVFKCSK